MKRAKLAKRRATESLVSLEHRQRCNRKPKINFLVPRLSGPTHASYLNLHCRTVAGRLRKPEQSQPGSKRLCVVDRLNIAVSRSIDVRLNSVRITNRIAELGLPKFSQLVRLQNPPQPNTSVLQ